jgi:hypothetical protein
MNARANRPEPGWLNRRAAQMADQVSRYNRYITGDAERELAQAQARIAELEMVYDCQGMYLHAAKEHIASLERDNQRLRDFAASVQQEGAGRLD